MKDVSNRFIVALLAIALIITIAGTIASLDKLNALGKFNFITGAATNATTGTSTITVQSVTELSLRVSSLSFGSGYVNRTCTACHIDTNVGIRAGNRTCCANFTNLTAGFLIENTGNENTTLNFSCSGSCTAAAFINGTSPSFQFRVVNVSDASNQSGDSIADTSSSCSSGADGGWNFSEWTDLSAAGGYLCGTNETTKYYFSPASSQDAVVFDIYVKIPDDAKTVSQKTATITFAASSPG